MDLTSHSLVSLWNQKDLNLVLVVETVNEELGWTLQQETERYLFTETPHSC